MKIRLRIITPTEVKVDLKADMVIMRCTTGDMGVLSGHAPHSAVLNFGVLRILDDGAERKIAVYGGLATVRDDTVTIMANGAEWPEEIDRARADADREHAERRLRERTDDIEIQEDLVRLRRALVQIVVSSNPIDDNEKTEK